MDNTTLIEHISLIILMVFCAEIYFRYRMIKLKNYMFNYYKEVVGIFNDVEEYEHHLTETVKQQTVLKLIDEGVLVVKNEKLIGHCNNSIDFPLALNSEEVESKV